MPETSAEPANRFAGITIDQWRQFDRIDLDFHRSLTVLTGANGSGKTTILNLLNRHFGWNLQFVATVVRSRKTLQYLSDLWSPRETPLGNARRIGEIRYTDAAPASLSVPAQVNQEYQIEVHGQQIVPGLCISSHRPAFRYQGVDSIPTQVDVVGQMFARYLQEERDRGNINVRTSSPSLRLKESLISLAVFGYGNAVVASNPEMTELFEGFQDILRKVLPKAIAFKRLVVEVPHVLLDTRTGRFPLDAASGGVAAIFDLAWQLFITSRSHDQFTVLIDEPENHLHPELQRALLPSLIGAFPGAQFIVTTHNPFVVGAVEDSNVYVLAFESGRGSQQVVRSRLLDTINKAGTSSEILRDVLGLEYTMGLWVERRLGELARRYSGVQLDADTLSQLVADLSEVGLADALPDVLKRLRDTP